jgi:hypothetical protein
MSRAIRAKMNGSQPFIKKPWMLESAEVLIGTMNIAQEQI